jgi:hypothetical protein
MADATSQLNILVRVKDEASAALSRLSNDVSDLGGSLNFTGDKAGILAGALAAIAGTAAISAIKSFADSEMELAKMDALLKTIPGGIEKYRDTILKAAEGALRFGFDNENAAFNLAKLFKATGDINFSIQALQAAMDLARFKGISLDDAVQALILAFQGGGRMLKQLGIEIDDHASKETILQAVINATRGQAEAFTQTMAGTWQLLKTIGSEIMEVLGEPFGQAFQLIGNFIRANFTNIIDLINNGLKPTIQGFIPFITAAIGGGIGLAVSAALSHLGILAAGTLSLFGPAGLLIGLITGFVILMIAKFEDIKNTAKAVIDFIREVWKVGWEAIKSIAIEPIEFIKQKIEALMSSVNSVISSIQRLMSMAGGAASSALSKAKSIIGLQSGGIVTSPTLAVVGEREPEAVIPLSKLGGLGTGGITINLNGDFYTDTETAEKFANQIAKIIKFQLKL